MSSDHSFEINEEIFEKILKKKHDMGFADKSWNAWFEELVSDKTYDKTNNIIEEIFQKAAYDKYYDDWIKNFALNLENIWSGHSAKELTPKTTTNTLSAIVIGRGPSLQKHNHLKLLADSNYSGTVICTDGVLKRALESGVTPEKFKKFFVVTIDTQLHALDFYTDPIIKKYGKGIKCILSSTAPITTYNAIKDAEIEVYWIHTLFDYNKGKTSFNYISGLMTRSKNQEGLPGIQTGGNVGTSAWMIAWSILKCKIVALIGIDLGYATDTSWETIAKYHRLPEDIDTTSEIFKRAFPTIYNPDFNCYCIQDPKFQFYCNALKEFIPKASKWVKTINATQGGALFGQNIECTSLENFLTQEQNR